MYVCAQCELKYDTSEHGVCPSCGGDVIPGPAADPLIGQVLDGKYRVDELLAEGGMAAVYRGRQVAIGRPVAIKVLGVGVRTNPVAYRRFRREAKAAGQLKHPNNVGVHDYGTCPDGRPFLVMDLVEGRPLSELPLPLRPGLALGIAQQICCALDEAHRAGVVHRDLKPENVVVGELDGQPFARVLDYGIAQVADATRLTVDGLPGTAGYLAPERAGGDPVDERCDIYSLGVILYELVVGHHPFAARDTGSLDARHLIRMHLQTAPPRPSLFRAMPDSLEGLILDCLAKDPEHRPASVLEVSLRIEVVLDDLALAAFEPLSDASPDLPLEPLWPTPPPTETAPVLDLPAPARTDDGADETASAVTEPNKGGVPPRRWPRWPLTVLTLGVAAGLALWLLASVSGGPAPPPALLSISPDSPSNQSEVTLRGRTEPNAAVRLFRDADCRGPSAATARADATGAFVARFEVPEDSETRISAQVYDPEEPDEVGACTGDGLAYVEDSTPPDPPALGWPTPAADGGAIVVDAETEPGGHVELFFGASCAGDPATEARADGGGRAHFALARDPHRAARLSARAIDGAGNRSPCGPDAAVYLPDREAAEWVFFLREQAIWRARPDGSGAARVTSGSEAGPVASFVVSGDGGRLVWVEASDGDDRPTRLVEAGLDAEGQLGTAPGFRDVSDSLGRLCDLHPDGAHVLALRAPDALSGGVERRGGLVEVDLDSGVASPVAGAPLAVGCGSYSADGASVLVTTRADGASLGSQLLEIDRTSGDAYPVGPSFEWLAAAPRRSPSGPRIAARRRGIGPSPTSRVPAWVTLDADGDRPLVLLDGAPLDPNGAAWSPDGGRLLVEGADGGLWRVFRDGSGATRLLENASSPAWISLVPVERLRNHDEWIVFARAGDVWRMRPDGSQRERISDVPTGATVRSLTAAPDGSQVVYHEFYAPMSPDNRLVAINLDGSGEHDVTPIAQNGSATVCDVHPSGERLFFSDDVPPGDDENREIFEVGLDGRHLRQLTHHPDNDGCGSYTPDGRTIFFQSGRIRCGACSAIHAISRRGGDRRTVADLGGEGTARPLVSPDGDRLLVNVQRRGFRDLVLLDLDGTHPLELTATPDLDEQVGSWSPDGAELLFDQSGDIWRMRRDGSGRHLLLAGAGDPTWVRVPAPRRELVENGDFEHPLAVGWRMDEDRRPREGVGLVEIVDHDGQPTALHLDSLASDNYYLTYIATVVLGDVPVEAAELSWRWRVDALEPPYGRAEIRVAFFEEVDAQAGVATFVYQRTGGDPSTRCRQSASLYCLDDTAAFAPGAWSTHRLWLADILDHLPGLERSDVARLDIRITSYNNAEYGADLYVDDVSLTVPDAPGSGS